MPLGLLQHTCNGRSCKSLDELDDHRSSCPRSGRLKKRFVPMERMLAQIFKEDGARVRFNKFVRNLNVPVVSIQNQRRLEVIAEGLFLYRIKQIAIDTTLVSPLSSEGVPRLQSNLYDVAAIQDVVRRKRQVYSDVFAARRCHLLVAAIETDGRWNDEFSGFVRHLAKSKS